MIVLFTWFSILCVVALIYWFINGSLIKNAVYSAALLYFAIIFFAVDYTATVHYELYEKYETEQITERYCELTYISENCTEHTYFLPRERNRTALFYSFAEEMPNVLMIFFSVSSLIALLILLFYAVDILKKYKLLK